MTDFMSSNLEGGNVSNIAIRENYNAEPPCAWCNCKLRHMNQLARRENSVKGKFWRSVKRVIWYAWRETCTSYTTDKDLADLTEAYKYSSRLWRVILRVGCGFLKPNVWVFVWVRVIGCLETLWQTRADIQLRFRDNVRSFELLRIRVFQGVRNLLYPQEGCSRTPIEGLNPVGVISCLFPTGQRASRAKSPVQRRANSLSNDLQAIPGTWRDAIILAWPLWPGCVVYEQWLWWCGGGGNARAGGGDGGEVLMLWWWWCRWRGSDVGRWWRWWWWYLRSIDAVEGRCSDVDVSHHIYDMWTVLSLQSLKISICVIYQR